MHWQQLEFVRAVKAHFPTYFAGSRVLELGSYDVNGSVRPEFDAACYVGVDLIAGPGVDVVCRAEDFRSDEPFDVVISAECFEHNPAYLPTFLNMARNTRPGGMVLFTCATTGRAEHGTTRSDPTSSPGTIALGQEYYQNLVEADFAAARPEALFACHRFYQNSSSHDLYFVGFVPLDGRPGGGYEAVADKLISLGRACDFLEHASRLIDEAWFLQRKGRSGEAIQLLQTMLSQDPAVGRTHILANLGWMCSDAGRGGEAEAAVREALSLSDAAELYWQLAMILHVAGRSADAVAPSRCAAERAPHEARFQYFLGAMLQGQNKLAEAEQTLQKAIQLDPGCGPAYHQISMVYIRRGLWTEAARAAELAVALAPDVEYIVTHRDTVAARLNDATAPPQP